MMKELLIPDYSLWIRLHEDPHMSRQHYWFDQDINETDLKQIIK